jgi:hypothetical protein
VGLAPVLQTAKHKLRKHNAAYAMPTDKPSVTRLLPGLMSGRDQGWEFIWWQPCLSAYATQARCHPALPPVLQPPSDSLSPDDCVVSEHDRTDLLSKLGPAAARSPAALLSPPLVVSQMLAETPPCWSQYVLP